MAIDIGPKQFLQFLINAAYIITDSFHGVCFSVNFNKDFTCLERFQETRGNENSRIADFLKDVDLETRLVRRGEKPTTHSICYDEPNIKLEHLRQKSKKYLSQILN